MEEGKVDRKTEIHDFTKECGDTHCHVCGVDEEQTPETHLVCFECNHVHQTAEQLLMAHNLDIADMNRLLMSDDRLPLASRIEEITCCPHCLHDF